MQRSPPHSYGKVSRSCRDGGARGLDQRWMTPRQRKTLPPPHLNREGNLGDQKICRTPTISPRQRPTWSAVSDASPSTSISTESWSWSAWAKTRAGTRPRLARSSSARGSTPGSASASKQYLTVDWLRLSANTADMGGLLGMGIGERSDAPVCSANRGANSPTEEVPIDHAASIAPAPRGRLGSRQRRDRKETKMRSTPIYEVHAVKYAHLPRKAWEVQITPDPHDADFPMDYFVWVAIPLDAEGHRKIGGKPIVIDTGFTAQVGKKRGREVKRNPADLLRDFGVDPNEVEDVVITHLHYDHVGNWDKFPKARFHLQDKEMQFATGRHVCHGTFRHAFEIEDIVGMVRAVYGKRVVFHAVDEEVPPASSVHLID